MIPGSAAWSSARWRRAATRWNSARAVPRASRALPWAGSTPWRSTITCQARRGSTSCPRSAPCRRPRPPRRPPPVIYVTGSEDSRVAVAALKAGAVDYVWKDIQGQFRELLGEAVDTALRQEARRQAKERAEAEMREARDRAELLLR